MENLHLYKKAKNQYTWNLKKARIDFFAANIIKCKNESKNLSKCLKDLTGTQNEHIVPTKPNKHQIAEEFSDFYVEKVLNIRNRIQQTKTSVNMSVQIDNKELPQIKFSRFNTININEL